MSDTPRTDAHAYDCEYRGDMGSKFTADPGKLDPYGDHVPADFARLLESELNAAKAALSGRTVSCSACNAMAEELAAMKKIIRKIYYETETCADGSPDATDHGKLCNEIAYELKPFIHNKDT